MCRCSWPLLLAFANLVISSITAQTYDTTRAARAYEDTCSLSTPGVQDKPIEDCFNKGEEFICWPPEGQRICHDTNASVIWNPKLMPALPTSPQDTKSEAFLQLYTKYTDPTSMEDHTIFQFNVPVYTDHTPIDVNPDPNITVFAQHDVGFGMQFLPIQSALGPSSTLEPNDSPLEVTLLFYDYENPVATPFLDACAPVDYLALTPCASPTSDSRIVSRTHTGPTITIMPPLARTVSWQPEFASSNLALTTPPSTTTSCPPSYVCSGGSARYTGPTEDIPNEYEDYLRAMTLAVGLPVVLGVFLVVTISCSWYRWCRKRRMKKNKGTKDQEEGSDGRSGQGNLHVDEPRTSICSDDQHDTEALPSYDEARNQVRDMPPGVRPPDYETH